MLGSFAAAAAAAANGEVDGSSPTSLRAEWKGHGVSQHIETRDLTRWHNVRLEAQVEWSGECVLTGCGVSVLKRSCLGATQALDALIREETERRARQLVTDAQRFPGQCFTLHGGDEPHTPLCKQPVTSAPTQSYPGVLSDEVVVPFVLLGRANLKTGAVSFDKTHIALVYNTISYAGRLRAIRVDDEGNEHDEPPSALMQCMEAATMERDAPTLVHALRLEMEARWSRASLAVIAKCKTASPAAPQEQGAQSAQSQRSGAAEAEMQDDEPIEAAAAASAQSVVAAAAPPVQCLSSEAQPSLLESAICPGSAPPSSGSGQESALLAAASPASLQPSSPSSSSSGSSVSAHKHTRPPSPPSPRSVTHGQHSA